MDNAAIVLLAGGDARRFPGKLEHDVDGEPMIVRVYRRLRAMGLPLFVAAKASFDPAIDAALDAPMLIDRQPATGPLAAIHSACTSLAARWIFAIAADMPNVSGEVLNRLAGARGDGVEAVVPRHDGQIEPLCALYDRRAILREAFALRRRGRDAMRDLIECVATRFEPVEGRYFYNVNRAADLSAKGAWT
jgi:molybdenum cofactor guanylyltransferase